MNKSFVNSQSIPPPVSFKIFTFVKSVGKSHVVLLFRKSVSHWLYQECYLVPVVKKLTDYWKKQTSANNIKVRPQYMFR